MNNEEAQFETLLNYLKEARGFDFTGYKQSSLMRRVLKRMQTINIDSFSEYIDFLSVHPEEFSNLFNTVLINVTAFFRDAADWDYLKNEILPKIIASKKDNEPIRVWCAGAASGQEAYSIAILLAELLGSTFAARAKIYATDLDEEALAEARQASYKLQTLDNVPEDLKQKYFVQTEENCSFRTDMRRAVIFGRHDLVQDAPISHLDLIICRNTLMYMNAETQAKIVRRFHFALNNHGYLFLGKAEMLLTYADLFQQLEMKHRVFHKITRQYQNYNSPSPKVHIQGHIIDSNNYLRDLCFDKWTTPHLVIDKDGMVVLINDKARSLFGLLISDIGKPLQELKISYRPLELRSLIDRVIAERNPIHISKVSHLNHTDGRDQFFDVDIMPLKSDGTLVSGISIIFTDVTGYYKVQEELQRSNQALETINEELQSAHEELETTNEELQSTNEELETTNEELQSTNEELETMNEELHSTNEELETTNSELRLLTGELDRSNNFLSSILTSLRSAVIVVDRQFKILVWNQRAEDLWGLRADEVKGKLFFDLDIGLSVETLRDSLMQALKTREHSQEFTVKATNRRGRNISCKIRCMPLTFSNEQDGSEGLVISIDEAEISLVH